MLRIAVDNLGEPADKMICARPNCLSPMKTISTFEAKDRLSAVIASAERGEPQIITKNGRRTAVVISFQEFERLTMKKIPLVEFLLDNRCGRA